MKPPSGSKERLVREEKTCYTENIFNYITLSVFLRIKWKS